MSVSFTDLRSSNTLSALCSTSHHHFNCGCNNYIMLWNILGMLSCDCRDSSLDDQARQQSLNTLMQRVSPIVGFYCMPDEGRSSSGTKTVLVPDEDLRGQNVVPLQSLLATWMLKTIDDYISETIAMSLYDINYIGSQLQVVTMTTSCATVVHNEDGLCTMVTNERQARELHMVRKRREWKNDHLVWLAAAFHSLLFLTMCSSLACSAS